PIYHDAGLAVGRLGVFAVEAHGLLGEPAEELGAVGDLSLGLGEGLAHLRGHHGRDVIGAFGEQFEGATQDLGAFAGCGGGPIGLCLTGGPDGGFGIGGGPVGDGGDGLAGGGIVHLDGLAALGRPPLAVDEQAGVECVDDRFDVHDGSSLVVVTA